MEVPQSSIVHHPRDHVQVLRAFECGLFGCRRKDHRAPVRYQMLQQQKDLLAAADGEDATEAYADAEVEAAYAAVTAPP